MSRALPWFWPDHDGRGMLRCKPVVLYHFYKRKQKPCIFPLPLFSLQKTIKLEFGVGRGRKEWKIWAHSVPTR